jgi:hypothetical protein
MCTQHGKAPSYLQELITLYKPNGALRSGNSMLLHPPNDVRTKSYGERRLLWNSLPLSLRNVNSLDVFKRGALSVKNIKYSWTLLKSYALKKSSQLKKNNLIFWRLLKIYKKFLKAILKKWVSSSLLKTSKEFTFRNDKGKLFQSKRLSP